MVLSCSSGFDDFPLGMLRAWIGSGVLCSAMALGALILLGRHPIAFSHVQHFACFVWEHFSAPGVSLLGGLICVLICRQAFISFGRRIALWISL